MFNYPKLSDRGASMIALISVIGLMILAVVCNGCALLGYDTEKVMVQKEALEAMRPHVEVKLPLLKQLIVTLKQEDRGPTDEEYNTVMNGFSEYELDLAKFVMSMEEASGGKGLLDSLLNLSDIGGWGDVVKLFISGNGKGSVVDPAVMGRLQAMERMTVKHGITMERLSNDVIDLTKAVRDFEKLIKDGNGNGGGSGDGDGDPDWPAVRGAATLHQFAKQLWGNRYDTPARSRDELRLMMRELRDAIIDRSGGYWGLSAPGKPDARPDIILRIYDNMNIDIFIAPASGSMIPKDHIWFDIRGPNALTGE